VQQIVNLVKVRVFAVACCVLFFATGRAFIPHLGLQNDEALFANGIYKPYAVAYALQVGHSRLPIMLMSYLGTLKSWIYRPIFALFGTGNGAIREPMLLAGVASIWLFFLFLRRAAGYRAALVGCGLLATDTLYLLTVSFDWGPVALQHMMLLAGVWLLLGFYQQGGERRLFWGCLVLGLAMWDKALMIWMLSGMGVAVLALYRRPVLKLLSWRRLAIAALAFVLGALPLVIYNANNRFVTFRGNTSWETDNIPGKTRLLLATADSGALFGWLVNEDWQTATPHTPKGLAQSASARISALTGRQRHTLLLYAFILALLLAPLGGPSARRAILFALITMAVAWVQMAVTANAGGSVHHAILLWPLPQMVIGISFAAASRRWRRGGTQVLAVVLAILMCSGLLVTNEYFYLMIRNGGGQNWTDAIFTLSRYLDGSRAGNIFCMDWGMMDSLRLLHRGKLPLRVGTDPISKPSLGDEDRKMLARQISAPDHLFLNHTKDWEFFPGINDRLVKYAADAGYRREILATISDRYGRPIYEVYHFVR
jgi:hypothetical protein